VLADPLERVLGAVDDDGVRPGVLQARPRDQRGGPDDDVGLGDALRGAQREQVRGTGPAPTKLTLPLAAAGHSLPPRVVRRAGTMTVDR
jgi:hypothetical protein